MLDNLKEDASIAGERDSLGGFVLESDVYDVAIDLAYFDFSKGGATSLTFHFKGKDGVNLRQTFWVTSGTAKGCNNFYIDGKGEKQYLPGFMQANALCKMAGGAGMADLVHEPKTIKVWNGELKKEVPVEREVLTGILGQEITLGVIKQIVDKNVKNDEGVYVPSGETREENEVDKTFRFADKLTNAEILAEETKSVFFEKWKEKNVGTVRNKAKGAKEGGAAKSGTPAGEAAPSLFGGNKS